LNAGIVAVLMPLLSVLGEDGGWGGDWPTTASGAWITELLEVTLPSACGLVSILACHSPRSGPSLDIFAITGGGTTKGGEGERRSWSVSQSVSQVMITVIAY